MGGVVAINIKDQKEELTLAIGKGVLLSNAMNNMCRGLEDQSLNLPSKTIAHNLKCYSEDVASLVDVMRKIQANNE